MKLICLGLQTVTNTQSLPDLLFNKSKNKIISTNLYVLLLLIKQKEAVCKFKQFLKTIRLLTWEISKRSSTVFCSLVRWTEVIISQHLSLTSVHTSEQETVLRFENSQVANLIVLRIVSIYKHVITKTAKSTSTSKGSCFDIHLVKNKK